MNGPTLIGGSGRSGTSILTTVLGRHDAVTDVPEWRFLIDPDGLLDFLHGMELWSPYRYDRALKRLEVVLRQVGRPSRSQGLARALQPYLPHLKLEARYSIFAAQHVTPEFPERARVLLDKLEAFRFAGRWAGMDRFEATHLRYAGPGRERVLHCLREFLEGVMSDVCRAQGATHYLEKNTWNILYFDRILELLPAARLLHIVRDPRDVVASFTKQSWMPSDPLQSARVYRDLLERWWEVRARVPEDRWLEITLEDLVQRKEETLTRVLTFMGLEPQPGIGDVLSGSSFGRWRKDFDPRTGAEITRELSAVLEAYGYEA